MSSFSSTDHLGIASSMPSSCSGYEGRAVARYEVHWLNAQGQAIALHTVDCQNDAEACALVRCLVQCSSTKSCVLYCGVQECAARHRIIRG